jgi:hypothetical protein
MASNESRFAAIFTIHGLLLGLATLSLFPMLRSAMGARRAWLSLVAAQFLAGAGFHALAARTECLFTALICFGIAATWWAFQRPGGLRWGVLGLVCGLAVGCRRTGMVMPVAVGIVLVVEAWRGTGSIAEAMRRTFVRGVFVAAGFAAGMLPELLASMLHGGSIQTYHEGVVGSHLSPLTRMWGSAGKIWLAVQTALRQPLYGVMAFVGAPLVIAAILARGRDLERPPTPLAAASGFALLVTLGLAAMSTLHILRYAYGNPLREPFHLYPRYLDPAESGVILAAVALAAWLFDGSRSRETLQRARSTLVRWILPLAILTWISGFAWRFRGGRIPSLRYFHDAPIHPWYHVMFMGSVLLMLVALMAWWSLGKYGTAWTVVGAVVLGWALSLHAIVKPARWDGSPPRVPPILQSEVLTNAMRAPIAVPVRRRAYAPRELYKPAFRSDHPVYWPKLRDLGKWLDDHPEGFVLTRTREREPGHRLRLELVGATKRWRLWAPNGREDVPVRLLDGLKKLEPTPKPADPPEN